MAEAESIRSTELHQKKSLRQVRELIDSIVMKRKLRTQIGNHYQVGSIAKPPTLTDVRHDVRYMNMTYVKQIMSDIYPRGGHHPN